MIGSGTESPTHGGLPGWVFVAVTIGGTVYAQIVLKWQVARSGTLPGGAGKFVFLVKLMVTNPWVLSAFIAAGFAAVAWMAALSVYELSVAYPFMSLSFILVAVASFLLLGEGYSAGKAIALLMIVAGLVVGSRF
jgi:multidrug transporter EmrE-like cation transporter